MPHRPPPQPILDSTRGAGVIARQLSSHLPTTTTADPDFTLTCRDIIDGTMLKLAPDTIAEKHWPDVSECENTSMPMRRDSPKGCLVMW